MASQLSDLDELVLKCRDEEAKSYVREAVACYKSGAIRSCIVATWVAVSYDLLGKLRDLSLTGDKEAEKQIDRFEHAQSSHNITQSLKFEREILSIARDKFELISPLEFTDLDRLQSDRNRCAHPSMASSEEPFEPTAELARYHLSNAVEHLLKREPVQGKSALDRLSKEINSEYFPTDTDESMDHLKHGPLSNPRDSLVRNFVIIILKKIIYNDLTHKEIQRYAAALNATRKMHREITENVLKKKMSELIRRLKDDNLNRVIRILVYIVDIWHLLDNDIQEKTKRYISDTSNKNDVYRVSKLLNINGLKGAMAKRIKKFDFDEAFNKTFFEEHKLLNNRRIKLYVNVGNYYLANDIAEELIYHTKSFDDDHTKMIIEGASSNSQITGSYKFSTLINNIREHSSLSDKQLDGLLCKNDLEEYE